MAVEATYMNNLLPSSQFLSNREIITPNNFHQHQQQQQLLNSAMYNAQMNSGLQPSALMANNQSSMIPFFQSSNANAIDHPIKTESGLTSYHHQIPLQRKRSRDFAAAAAAAGEFDFATLPPQQKNKLQQQPFINNNTNQDALFQFQNQTQSEIDRVLAHHTEKVRMEMEEQRLRQSRVLLSFLQETTAKKMKEKDEEIQRMEKLNLALQERVKTLSLENQVWKELAHTNETTANYLRNNLEQIISYIGDQHGNNNCAGGVAPAVMVADDAESSCGSNNGGAAEDAEDTAAMTAPVARHGGGGRGMMMCKGCGVRESTVLLLPCRHLCLCNMCGSTVRKCPVCDSNMDASLRVNLSRN